ncbi:unnamed protein product [Paramecium octaurelia]|uniref:WD domain, G-beta repeat protein n=1 Tax=Paramecium octaurelia TaxID=43137 RepID=A0A8S1Y9F8_PAROT|nr:unnamed protein product [Paramecium octaurelia]
MESIFDQKRIDKLSHLDPNYQQIFHFMIQTMDNSQVEQNTSQKCFSHNLVYSIIQEYPFHCFAQAINYNNTLIAFGSKYYSKVIYQKNDKFKYLLQIKLHKNVVSTLNFFNDRSQLISGSYGSSILIHSLNLLSSSKHIATLKEHTRLITCLVVIQNSENLLISGSSDKNIKFWTHSQNSCWSCTQTISEHLDQVNGLSLNQGNKQLISCGRDKQILIMDKSADQFWYVKQKIQENGFRISFITTDIFAFQPFDGTHLFLYTLDPATGLFIKSRELAVSRSGQACQYFFPQVYVASKQLLVSKNGYWVNLIKFNFHSQGWDCKLEVELNFDQSGNFGNIFGTISNNGEFLVTWDCKSGTIEFRKLIYKQQIE